MKFDFPVHRRRSIRLPNYDYSQNGVYFITICTKYREYFFGKVVDKKKVLSEIGKISAKCWFEIPNHFPFVKLDAFVITPNYIHGIFVIDHVVEAKNFLPIQKTQQKTNGTSKTVGSIIRGYKIGVTKWRRKHADIHDVWYRNYYEHIIRNNRAFEKIRDYVHLNLEKWNVDKFY